MSIQAIIFRNIEDNDIKRCADLYSQVFSSKPWNEEWNTDLAMERLSHFYHSKGFIGVLAEEKQDVMGFALGNTEPYYFGSIFYLREMCIKTKLQNQGLGKITLKALKKELSANKINKLYLTTERAIPAANFYQQNGFKHSEKMGFYAKQIP